MILLNDAVGMLEFEEGMQMVNVKRSLQWMENCLGIPVQVQCTVPRPEQLKTIHHRNNYNDSTLTAPETQEEVRSQVERALIQMVKQHIHMLKRDVTEQTQDENHTILLAAGNNKVGNDSLSPPFMGFWGMTFEIP